ncbi:ABC transporter ATP-binding protein/permease [Rickettsiales bacterium]|nr:ABC transporter ATP-binding protein/permease [Rickettsiales bacterium]
MKNEGNYKIFELLMPYLWYREKNDLKLRVILSVLCMIVAKSFTIITPIILGKTVDSLPKLNDNNVNDLSEYMIITISLIIAYGLARISSFVFGELRDTFFSKVSQNAVRLLSLKVFQHIHSLPLQFHLNKQTGSLSRLIDRGTKGVDFLLRYIFFNILPTLIEIILVSIILFSLYGFEFFLIIICTIMIYVISTFKITSWRTKFRREMNNADNQISTKIIDSLINYETVKYFSNERHEYKKLDFSLKKYEIAANNSRYSLSFLNITQTVIIMIGIIIMLTMSVFEIKNGVISVGAFIVINSYMLQLYQPLNFLGSVYREIKQSLIDMENMFTLLDEKIIPSKSKNNLISKSKVSITFKNVSFFYDEKRQILKDISFHIPAGKKTAIVGETGAGKSTIGKLLFNFYKPNKGKIFINNLDSSKISEKILRDIIGVVPQDIVLFNDSIYYNIMYGRTGANKEEIILASKNANIHNFIMNLPYKYDTIVGERGLKLSGGEKQRVSIARTLLKDPQILLFDEATSALDLKTEKEIQINLENISEDKTTLIITHRLSTIINSDNIIFLEKGKVIEEGRHIDLLAKKGHYYKMWQKQII